MDTIYQRTSKGDEEIAKRTFKLDHEHRFVLIMVDGRATAENIISRSSEQWHPQQCLVELELKGFIKNIVTNDSDAPVISGIKQNLILSIQKSIPNYNDKIINKILKAPMNKASLSKAIDSSCIFIKLTISEEISSQLKVELHKILNESSEF